MKFSNSLSRPGKLWYLIAAPGKSWKIKILVGRLIITADVEARTM